MEEDESILEGCELHKYLIDVGYVDFEPLNIQLTPYENEHPITENQSEDLFMNNVNDSKVFPMIQEHCCRQIDVILKSTLLFSEDVDTVDIFSTYRCIKNSNFVKSVIPNCLTLVGLTGFTILCRKWKSIWLIPSSVASFGLALFTGNLFWQLIKQKKWERQLAEHIKTLQQICGTIQKLLRFLKETEVISTGKVQITNVGSISYFKSRLWETQPDLLSDDQTLPKLRKYIAKLLIELSIDISKSSTVIQKLPLVVSSKIPRNSFSSNSILYQVIGMNVSIQGTCISLLDLNKLNEMYLLIQSDYMKNISLCFCDYLLWEKSSDNLSCVYNSIKKLNQQLCGISYDLQLQYTAIVTPQRSVFKNISNRTSSGISDTVYNEFHNVYLQLNCLLYIIKNIEDKIEPLNEHHLVHHIINHHSKNVNEFNCAFESIKTSLMKIDNITKKLSSKTRVGTSDENSVHSEDEPTALPTKVYLGASDYEIRMDNVDVFLGVCDTENNEHDDNNFGLDCDYEQNISLRKNVLRELMMNLEFRKQEFEKKEKLALEQKGLTDLDSRLEAIPQCSGANISYTSSSKDRHLSSIIYSQQQPVDSTDLDSTLEATPQCFDVNTSHTSSSKDRHLSSIIYSQQQPVDLNELNFEESDYSTEPNLTSPLPTFQRMMFSDEIQHKFNSWGLVNDEEEYIYVDDSDNEEAGSN